jgi:hypothetical protein
MSENTENTENTENVEQTEKTTETKQTITVAGKTYLAESLNEQGINLINDIRKVETSIAEKTRDISICNVAKIKLLELFIAEADNFTEIEVPQPEEKAN